VYKRQTFHKSPVVLRRADGSEIELLCGQTPVSTGNDGEEHGELEVNTPEFDQVERWELSFNRDYLQEQNLVDGELLITVEDWILIGGRRFAIVAIADRAVFRGQPILVRLTVAR
jgi:hypothetical protein